MFPSGFSYFVPGLGWEGTGSQTNKTDRCIEPRVVGSIFILLLSVSLGNVDVIQELDSTYQLQSRCRTPPSLMKLEHSELLGK